MAFLGGFIGIEYIMHSGSRAEQDVYCIDCGMSFETQAQLLNHKRRFCLNSGYDDLEGLAKI